jgi:type II secretory pathway component GspD/PulD (secretin)
MNFRSAATALAATLVVGSQYPILKSTTDLSQNNNTVSDYSYVDIGINLKATPHINPENDVTLDIDFKVSSILEQITMPGGTSGVSTTVPEIGKREVTSTLTVKDGHTLVICGIISQNHTENKSNPAWAGDIPWIGWIFGNESEQRGQTELIVLINPTVVDCPEAEDKLTSSEERKISVKPAEFKDFKRFFEAGKDPRDVLRRESPAPAAAPAPAPGKEADANPKEDPKDKKQGSFFEDLLN